MKTTSQSNCSGNLINAKKRFLADNLQVKITSNEEEFGQAKQLLSRLTNLKNTGQTYKHSAQQQSSTEQFLFDGYDSYAEHLVIKDLSENKVIAYVRIIDSSTASTIGGYFCETQFSLDKLRLQLPKAMEMSHLAIDPDYYNKSTFETLWSGIKLYAYKNQIDSIFGIFSIAIEDNYYSASREINLLKSKYLSSNEFRVKPYQILPPTQAIANQSFKIPEMLGFLFSKGARLCGDASWNSILNQADLFLYIKPDQHDFSSRYIQNNTIGSTDLVA